MCAGVILRYLHILRDKKKFSFGDDRKKYKRLEKLEEKKHKNL
jgi:hypothetical protein